MKRRKFYNNSSKLYYPPLWLRLYSKYLDYKITKNFLGDEIETPFREQGFFNTQSTEYDELNKIFKDYPISSDDVFVDIGCGTGRVIAYLLYKKKLCNIIGIEINSDVIISTEKFFNKYENVQFFKGNAIEELPLNTTVIYLYNPFDFNNFVKLIDRIENNFSHIRVIYFNLKFLDFFVDRKGWTIEIKKIKSIARKKTLNCAYLTYRSSL